MQISQTALVRTVLATALLDTAASASAEPVYLKPGQCIHLGNQEVCAMMGDIPGATAAPVKPNLVHLCRYGFHVGRELPDLKNYALFQVLIRNDGTRVETLIKHFGTGDKDKAECDKEAEGLNETAKK
jgi:hypothetical protein